MTVKTTVADRMACGNQDDLAALLAEGEFAGLNHSETADRCCGFADWIGYLPTHMRACWVANGEPIWFDASSLEHAINQVVSGADLIN